MSEGRSSLSEIDRMRYLRQIAVEELGEIGQERLRNSTVTVMGVGGLGSPVSTYLTSAGIGRLILVDYQAPELSNLNRQVLHWERDVSEGKSKSESAVEKLNKLNSSIEIIPKVGKIGVTDLGSLTENSDVIVDCLDNFEARIKLNAYCVKEGIPFVHAAVEGFGGQLTTIIPGQTPCLECIFPTPPKKKGIVPIFGFTAGVFGCMEAAEVIKLITGIGRPLSGRMLIGDLAEQFWDIVEIERCDECPTCGR